MWTEVSEVLGRTMEEGVEVDVGEPGNVSICYKEKRLWLTASGSMLSGSSQTL